MSIYDAAFEQAKIKTQVSQTPTGPVERPDAGDLYDQAFEEAKQKNYALAAPIDDPSKRLPYEVQSIIAGLDTPAAKRRAVAERMFGGDVRATKMTSDGRVAYLDPKDGEWYYATGDIAPMASGMAVKGAPAMVGAVAGGVLGGPPGAVIGGAVGALGGEYLENALFNDEPNYLNSLMWELGGQGVGEVVNLGTKAGTRAISRSLNPRYGLPQGFDPDEILRLQQLARDRGMEMNLAEAYGQGNPVMLQFLMKRHPMTATAMGGKLAERESGVDDAIAAYLDSVGTKRAPAVAEARGLRAVRDYKGELKRRRGKEVDRLYSESAGDIVDIDPVIGRIKSLLETHEGTAIGRKLKSWEKMLSEKVDDEILPKERVDQLQSVKIEMQETIGKLREKRPRSAAILGDVERELRAALHEQSEKYAAGDLRYSQLSKGVDRVGNTIAGQQAEAAARNPAKTRLSSKLFDPKESSVAEIRRARRMIKSQNPQAWDDLVRGEMERVIENTRDILATGERANIPGNFIRSLKGSRKTRELWEEAVGRQKLNDLESMLDVMQRIALVSKENSWTAPAGEMLETLKGTRQASMFNIPGRLADAFNKEQFTRNFGELFDLIWSQPKTAREVRAAMVRINRMSPDFIRRDPKALEAGVRALFAQLSTNMDK